MLGLPKGEVFLVLWPEDWLKEFLLDKGETRENW